MPDIPSKSMEDGALEVRMSEKRIDKFLEGTSRSFFLILKVLPKKIR